MVAIIILVVAGANRQQEVSVVFLASDLESTQRAKDAGHIIMPPKLEQLEYLFGDLLWHLICSISKQSQFMLAYSPDR